MSNPQQLRKSYLTLSLPAPAAIAAGVATLIVGFPACIVSAQLTASDTGAGGGALTSLIKVNGVAVATSGPLSIAQGAAVAATKVDLKSTINNFPGGIRVQPGDVVTVDVTAVPGGTPPKAAAVILSLVQMDA